MRKYKEGDRVKIQSLERYNKYKNRYGDINYGCETEILFTSEMSSFCGQVATITRVRYIGCVRFYNLAEDKGAHLWVAGMFEGLAEEETKPKFKVGDKITKGKTQLTILNIIFDKYVVEDNFGECCILYLNTQDEWKLVEEEEIEFTEEDKYWCDIMSESDPTTYVLPQGYQFVDENGNVVNATKITLEKKKRDIRLTQEQINTIVHDSCVLFCKHCGCGIPRETCTSLGTCKEHDEYRDAIRTRLCNMNKNE